MRGCPICGSDEFPHNHDLGVVLNSRYYCPDGGRHVWEPRGRWFWRREICVRCDERKLR